VKNKSLTFVSLPDRSIYEDSIFAKILMTSGNMDERDYRTYMDLFSNMSNFMRKPNLIVHLDVTPEVCAVCMYVCVVSPLLINQLGVNGTYQSTRTWLRNWYHRGIPACPL
jgi:hypothetical protein